VGEFLNGRVTKILVHRYSISRSSMCKQETVSSSNLKYVDIFGKLAR